MKGLEKNLELEGSENFENLEQRSEEEERGRGDDKRGKEEQG